MGRGFGRGRGPRGRRARRGEVREAVLLLLSEAPSNGYQLMQTLQDRTNGTWRPSPGAMYPALAQLEDEGLIEAVPGVGRKAFRLTDAAEEHVAELNSRPTPWAFATEKESSPEGELWSAYEQLGLAVKAVGAAHSDDENARATSALIDARATLYRILAGDE